MLCPISFAGKAPPLTLRVIKLKMMLNKKIKRFSAGGSRQLETEYPLCEKDEQARGIEQLKKLQKEALKLWRALKKKRT